MSGGTPKTLSSITKLLIGCFNKYDALQKQTAFGLLRNKEIVMGKARGVQKNTAFTNAMGVVT